MRFSEFFHVTPGPEDDWYDPLLTIDTALGIDPFLIFTQRLPHFEDAADTIFAFFNSTFELIAESGGDQESLPWKRAVLNLRLGEMEELCLGVSESGTAGSGAGSDLSKSLALGMLEAIQLGLEDPQHFEQVSIFRNGFGIDRISDIVGHIVVPHLANYTVAICGRHGVPISKAHFARGRYELARKAWTPTQLYLPLNPYNGRPVLLAPRQYLREDTTISPDGFWRHAYYHHNQDLREYFGAEIAAHANKENILTLARRRPEFVREYISHVEQSPPRPYDLDRDPDFLYRWDPLTKAYVADRGLEFAITTNEQFQAAIDAIIAEFKHFVEQNGGWELLKNDDGTPKHERAGQRLLLGIVGGTCRRNNIDVSPEPNIGRGAVDFKFAIGVALRTLLEVKLVRNTKFWDGLIRQLPAYMEAERVRDGYFVAVAFNDEEMTKAADYRLRLNAANADGQFNIRFIIVDARRPLSASLIH